MADDTGTLLAADTIERDPIWQEIVDRHLAWIQDGCDHYGLCRTERDIAADPILTDRHVAIWHWWHYGDDAGGALIPGIQEEMHKYGFYADGWGDDG